MNGRLAGLCAITKHQTDTSYADGNEGYELLPGAEAFKPAG